jgi:hypothetical protein
MRGDAPLDPRPARHGTRPARRSNNLNMNMIQTLIRNEVGLQVALAWSSMEPGRLDTRVHGQREEDYLPRGFTAAAMRLLATGEEDWTESDDSSDVSGVWPNSVWY